MVEISEIVDARSLQAWLEARSEETRYRDAVAIASRCAMRVFPNLFEFEGRRAGGPNLASALPILRALVTGSIANRYALPIVRDAAYISAEAAVTFYFPLYNKTPLRDVANAAKFAADAACDTTAFTNKSTAFSAASAAFNAVKSEEEVAQAFQEDCARILENVDVLSSPLWYGDRPQPISANWRKSLNWLRVNPGHDFWISWYEAALEGRP